MEAPFSHFRAAHPVSPRSLLTAGCQEAHGMVVSRPTLETPMLAAASVNWFEIPSADLDRATKFYESVLGVKLAREAMGPMQFSVFPAEPKQPTGCLMAAPDYRPSAQGATIYLNLADNLDQPLAKVEKAGGKVLKGKTALPEGMGFYAQFLDSEGNRVGFYSPH
jgi:predicted enzyme related to lactoylglutathione lyase